MQPYLPRFQRLLKHRSFEMVGPAKLEEEFWSK